jgi:hypothetical protein
MSAATDPALRHSVAAVQYAEDVRDGKNEVCKLTVKACVRFLDDLAWQGGKNFGFYYDAGAAVRA